MATSEKRCITVHTVQQAVPAHHTPLKIIALSCLLIGTPFPDSSPLQLTSKHNTLHQTVTDSIASADQIELDPTVPAACPSQLSRDTHISLAIKLPASRT